MTTATGSINVHVLHHDKYACVHVPALPIGLFKDAITEFRRYQDDEDLPLSRLQHVYSVTREFPEPAEISGFAECETWTLPGEAAEAFNRIWTENESRA
jgi:hypothetical protein